VRLLLFSPILLGIVGFSIGCGGWGGGTSWVNQPLVPEEERASVSSSPGGAPSQPAARTIGGRPTTKENAPPDTTGSGGKVLGTFRNTYYDFPNEADHGGAPVSLMNAKCETIAKVPRGFYDAVCVQGSGSLASGGTVSFAKRDCACAEICPRTNQRICFDALDKAAFPWGRGASGAPITPLRSVAADTQVLPMGTVLYIPELDGVRGTSERASDGCFVVEDRGLKVQGEHVDIFTGNPAQTAALNAQVPSNHGVTVVVDSPRCAHLTRR
jgi:3D (Asp-Asp-Asp) domain-containing protein